MALGDNHYPINQLEYFYVKTIDAVQDQIKLFECFRGEHSKLDMLLCNMEEIMSKYREELATLDKFRSNNNNSAGGNHKEITKLSMSDDMNMKKTGPKTKPGELDSHDNPTENEVEVQPPIDHKVFTVELVMLKILNYLPFSDLKQCREINTNFKLFADQVISNRRHGAVKFIYRKNVKEYVCKLYEENPKDKDINNFTLSAFTKFFASRPGFPCEAFEFFKGTLRSRDLQEFLTIYGNRIRELLLDVYYTTADENIDDIPQTLLSLYPTINLIKTLLLHQVPNLQRLYLRYCPNQWLMNEYCNQLFPEPQETEYTLPILQMLSVDDTVPDSLLYSLLEVCINLHSFHGPYNDTPLPIFRANKLYLLETFTLKFESTEVLEVYEKSSFSLMPQLTSFTWAPNLHFINPGWFPKLSQISQQILEASSTTLEHICWDFPAGFLEDLKIPVLPKVKLLEFYPADLINMPEFEQLSKKQFPSGFDLKICFPNLDEVRIFVNNSPDGEEWEPYFDNYTPVTTVKTLSFEYSDISNIWFRNMAALFPNIRTLKVGSKIPLNQAAQCGLWNFCQLEFLDLTIRIDDEDNHFPALDSAFTGFSFETCCEMQKSLKAFDIMARIDELREFPSILNAKNLKELKICFDDLSNESRLSYPLFITNVTSLFAFKMCPQVKIIARAYLENLGNSQALINALSVLDNYADIKFPFNNFKQD